MMENTIFPGLPNYVGPDRGLGILLHHGDLFELSWSFSERVEYIKKYKAYYEIPIRLEHIICVPLNRLPNNFRIILSRLKGLAGITPGSLLYFTEKNGKLPYSSFFHIESRFFGEIDSYGYGRFCEICLKLLDEYIPNNKYNKLKKTLEF